MEIRAYYEEYLDDAQATMGNMFDYAINGCGIDGDDFFHMFLASGVASQFEHGNPKYLSGMSGAEIVRKVVLQQKNIELIEPEEYFVDKSPEYWAGWILAFYQWRSCLSFTKIYQIVTVKELLLMYPTHHEADEEHFFDSLNLVYKRRHTETYISQKMRCLGLNAKTVEMKTGIPLQLIERLQKDFSAVKQITALELYRLSLIFGCTMEELMEV